MIYQFSFIERILLNQNLIPHPMNDAAVYAGLSKALTVAVKLGLTKQLSKTPQSAEVIAGNARIKVKGTVLLLNCLEALGYVTQKDGQYAFNQRGDKFLNPDSPDNYLYFIQFGDILFESLVDLEKTIVNGEPTEDHLETYGPEEWEIYCRAMYEIARTTLPQVMKKVNVPDTARKLLDLGGSHGNYSIGFCRKYDQLQSTIYDFEAVRSFAEDYIMQAGMGNRISFEGKNFMTESLPSGNVLVFLFNIIHSFSPEGNQELLNKIYASMNPGGQLILFDQILGLGRKSQLTKSLVAYMGINLYHQANGRTYAFEEIENWSKKAGFSSVRMAKMRVPGCGLLTIVK